MLINNTFKLIPKYRTYKKGGYPVTDNLLHKQP